MFWGEFGCYEIILFLEKLERKYFLGNNRLGSIEIREDY